jgi:hypothetical protein
VRAALRAAHPANLVHETATVWERLHEDDDGDATVVAGAGHGLVHFRRDLRGSHGKACEHRERAGDTSDCEQKDPRL